MQQIFIDIADYRDVTSPYVL